MSFRDQSVCRWTFGCSSLHFHYIFATLVSSQNVSCQLWICASFHHQVLIMMCVRGRSSPTKSWGRSTNHLKPNAVCWGILTCSSLTTASAACCHPTSENISTRGKSKNSPVAVTCVLPSPSQYLQNDITANMTLTALLQLLCKMFVGCWSLTAFVCTISKTMWSNTRKGFWRY